MINETLKTLDGIINQLDESVRSQMELATSKLSELEDGKQKEFLKASLDAAIKGDLDPIEFAKQLNNIK